MKSINIKKYKNKTQKQKIKINGRILQKYSKEGWIYLEIYGEAYERGFAHGYLLYNELNYIFRCMPFIVKNDLDKEYNEFLKFSNEFIYPVVETKYPEFYKEINGIYNGAKSRGGKYPSIEELIAWNSYMSLYSYFKDGIIEDKQKCSAFIAVGSATKTGEIIMAHNSHSSFIEGQFYNIILCIKPLKGTTFKMQTAAGLISSTTDWFITDYGIMGCETTISGIKNKPRLFESPYFCRIRKAMQYGKTIDDYYHIMKIDNAGDYSCSWLFGDITTGEIARIEVGVNHITKETTKNGYFIGMNSAMNIEFRINETENLEHNNSKYSVGSRFIRLEQLLGTIYKGKITVSNARKIIADHYDSYNNINQPNALSICKHCETDNSNIKIPYSMTGAFDGKVISSSLAKNGVFWARFGSACGRKFSVSNHIKKHPEFKKYLNYMKDFLPYKWVLL